MPSEMCIGQCACGSVNSAMCIVFFPSRVQFLLKYHFAIKAHILLNMQYAARKTSQKDQLDVPARWTSWADKLGRSAGRTS